MAGEMTETQQQIDHLNAERVATLEYIRRESEELDLIIERVPGDGLARMLLTRLSNRMKEYAKE